MIGRYEVIRPLGRGGMGQVFLASDPSLERQVALKLLVHETDPTARKLMQDEAKALAALSHPNIVTIFEIGDDGGQLFIAMEYLPGKSLREVLQDDHPSRETLLEICAQVATAVDAAHAANILHRDIKPENVVVGKTGVKVVDFGIARRMDRVSMPTIRQPARARANEIVDAFMRTMIPEPANSTIDTEAPAVTSLTQTMFGTPAYMAPEVLSGEAASKASDVYALGVMLHECLTGRRPYDAPNLAEMIARAIDGTDAVPRIDDPLGELIEQMLDRDPAKRPTLATIAGALTRRRSTVGAPPPPPRRRWLLPAVFAGLTAGALAVFALVRHDGNRDPEPVGGLRGKLALRTISVEIPSYGAQQPDPLALSKIMEWRVVSTGVPVVGADVLDEYAQLSAGAARMQAAARISGAAVLAETSITERDNRLFASVSTIDLTTFHVKTTRLSTKGIDVAEMLDLIAGWLVPQLGPIALDTSPNHERGRAFFEEGLKRRDDGKLSQARAYLDEAVHFDRTMVRAWSELAQLLQLIQAPDAAVIEAYEQAIERTTDAVQRHVLRAQLLRYRGDFKTALAEVAPLETETLSRPSMRDVLFEIGEAHWHDGHFDTGYDYFKRVLAIDSSFTEASRHAGEYTLARRMLGEAKIYMGIQHSPFQWIDFAAGDYQKLAGDNSQFGTWARDVLELPPLPFDRTTEPVALTMSELTRAAATGDRDATGRALDSLFSLFEHRPYTGMTSSSMIHVGEVVVGAEFADESRRILDYLKLHSPKYNYKRLAILAGPMLGAPSFQPSELSDRLRKLSDAIGAEIGGDRTTAARLLGELVRDPTWEWDFVERIALIRNLRALGRTAEADAVCADTMKPVIIRNVFHVARAYCRKR